MKTPTDLLRDEHRLILRALALLEAAAARQAAGSQVPEPWWAALIAWLRAFADRKHHAKEESLLFPALAEAGVPVEGGPIGVMLAEHVQGRALVDVLAAGSPAERQRAARQYIELLRAHIAKENDVLFPLAEAVVDGATQRELASRFTAMGDAQGRDAELAGAEAVVEGLAVTLITPAA